MHPSTRIESSFYLIHDFFFLSIFEQVYKDNELYYYIDGYDESKSNWMRYVNPAFSTEAQNLIAYQYDVRIVEYFHFFFFSVVSKIVSVFPSFFEERQEAEYA